MDTGRAISDGLLDSDELPDDADIIDDSDLRQFASALQDTRCCAVQMENEGMKMK